MTPSREAIEEDRHQHWGVTVDTYGEEIVRIETDCLSGREISVADEDAIRTAAYNLLNFIGESHLLPQPTASDDIAVNDIIQSGLFLLPPSEAYLALLSFRAEATLTATLAERERAARQLDLRAEELTTRANAHFEEGDQGSAIIERTSAQEARVNAAAIRRAE